MNLISKNRTAILVFARTSQEEVKHKKISKGKSLFDALTKHTLKTVGETGFPFFHFTEKEQAGLSFGQRFSNAIQSVFDQGYEQIITVGNDSPHLTKTHIATAISAVDRGNLVLGPSSNDGFYLMGLHKKDFNKEIFENLPWQTSKLRGEVIELLSTDEFEYFLLPQLFDIDSFWDVFKIAKSTSGLSRQILEAIQLVISALNNIEFSSAAFFNEFYSRVPSNRGSPLYSFS